MDSLLGPYANPVFTRDVNVTVGKFPFYMHNQLLMNDDVLGVVVSKNNLHGKQVSNVNVQCLAAFDDVDAFATGDGFLFGVHVAADYRRMFFETTYLFASHESNSSLDTHFVAGSMTKFYGPWTWAARGLLKFGDRGGRGAGQLFVLESNYTRLFEHHPLDFEYGVFYCNAFLSTAGWNSAGGANFNRLRTSFETNPLRRVAAVSPNADVWGIAYGGQFFRNHEDESLTAELGIEEQDGDFVWGIGMRFMKKTSSRSYLELLGITNYSSNPTLRREGVFVAHTFIF
jgi:hypothetical protein